MNAPFETKLAFYAKVRAVCREQVQFGDYSNASELYSRCAQVLKSIPKSKLETMSEEELRQRTESLTTLLTNIAHCLIKKNQLDKAIKAAKEAISFDPANFKAHLRLGQALRDKHEFEEAVESYKQAIKLQPNDKGLRDDYKGMIDYKNAKVKEWNSKMMGFFDKAEVREKMA